MGLADHWTVLAMQEVWSEVSASEYFVAEWTAVPALKNLKVRRGAAERNTIFGMNPGTPEHFIAELERRASRASLQKAAILRNMHISFQNVSFRPRCLKC